MPDPADKPTRRAFLGAVDDTDPGPRATGGERQEGASPDGGGDDRAEDCATAPLIRVAHDAMGCRWEFLLCGLDGPVTVRATAAMQEVDRWERRLSVYRDDSDLSRINRLAGAAAVPVDGELMRFLTTCGALARRTGGAFDAACGRLVRAWGFLRGPRRVPAEGDLAAARAASGWRHVRLDARGRTVRFAVTGVELNPNSIGKGWALDMAARVLTAADPEPWMRLAATGPGSREAAAVSPADPTDPDADGCGGRDDAGPGNGHGRATSGAPARMPPVKRFLLNAGRSSILARGSPDGVSDADGWWVSLADPRRGAIDDAPPLGRIRLLNTAMGTTGAAERYFDHAGRRYGHTLDPRTGRPAEGMLSVTVLAPTAGEADAISTAVYVLGPREGVDFLRRNRPYRAVVVPAPGVRDGGSGEGASSDGAPLEIWTVGLAPADVEIEAGRGVVLRRVEGE